MTRLTAGDATIAADLMSRLHPGWDIPGARRLSPAVVAQLGGKR